MLAAIRRFAKSPASAVLIGILVVAFALWGLNDVFRAGAVGDHVVKVGSRTLSSADFRREYDNYRKRMEAEAGQRLTPEIADANGIDRGLLNSLATRESFAELLHKAGIRPSDKLIVSEVSKIPAFMNPISGQFDRAAYVKALGDQGMTPTNFEQILRDELATQHFATAMVNGLEPPRAYGALGAVFGLETRDVAFIQVTPQSIAQPTAPTDAQLLAFMKENAAQLTRPETRILTVVRFSPAAVPPGPVDEAEIKKLYDFRKDTFSQPETRTFVQIPVKDAATAQKAIAQLSSGAAPAAVAKSLGVDPIMYEAKPKTAVTDRRVADAAFKAAPGQVLQVQGELGGAVIRVVSVNPGRTVSLEEARPMLEAEARKNAAAEKVYALSQAYDEAHQGGSSLAESAQKAGVPTATVGPLTREGASMQGPVPGVTPQMLEVAFGLPAGGESDLTDAGNGEYFAVRVERVIPSALPPLAEVRNELANAWMLREAANRMEARANELSARVAKGEALDAVAKSAGLQVVRINQVSRQGAQQQGFGGELAGRAFAAKPGEVFVSRTPQFGYGVAVVSNVKMDASPVAAMIAQQQGRQMAQTLFREMSEAAQAYARTSLKTKTDVNRARAAIGLEPLETKAGTAKK